MVAFSLRHARHTLLRFQVVNLSLHHPLLQCQVVHLPLLHPIEGLLPHHVLLMKLHHAYSLSREGALSEPAGPAIPDSYNWYLLLLIRQDNEKPYEFLHLMTYTYYEVNKFHSIIFYGYLRSYNGFFSSHFHFSNPATKIYQIIVLLKLH